MHMRSHSEYVAALEFYTNLVAYKKQLSEAVRQRNLSLISDALKR